ncbi:hypothetical protein LA080_007739 [Diaporthe eres]|uniref:Uncharacterized protein n=1 Tax=Diaporthe vaccinii TaxID=105482 RepID=A0ABR4EF18_9PEZI|nr:hypothetical protein LA080_007739 [Diaporthe eres]
MAPKQKTFELIPDLPGLAQAQQQRPADAAAAVQSKPPMTTKQAKKLYRQKGKGPKLSKAEQRRIDLMEQDRIRKEFEKDKAQARARTAREKKKAKEDKERDEKRKRGLPLNDVHPSQDTISRFISRLGFGGKNNSHLDPVQEADTESAESDSDVRNEPCEERKGCHVQDHDRKAQGKENEDPADALGDSAARPAKRQKLGQPSRNLLDRMIQIPSQRSVGAVARVAQEMEMESWSRPSSIDTDDPATEAMLEDQLIADVELASSKSVNRSSPNRQSSPREPLPSRVQPPSHASPDPRVPSPSPPPPPPPPRPQSRPQPPRPQKLQGRHLPAGTRIPMGEVPRTEHFRAKAKPVDDVFKKPASPFVPGGRQGPATRCAVAAKPPAPPRFKPPAGAVVPRSGRPRFLPKPTKAAPAPVPVQASPTYAGSRGYAFKAADAFPSSTQLLVMNHVDELFPTPSQEARELHEDQQPAKMANIPTGRPSLLYRPPFFTDGHVDHEVGRPSAVAPGRPTLPPQDQRGANTRPEIPFLATQDLILSSQDIAELDTPSKVRTGPASRTLHVASHGNSLLMPPERLALPSNEKTRVVSRVQAPKDAIDAARTPSAEVAGVALDCCHLPASKNESSARGKPLGQTVKEVTHCPTQALIRPRSQRLQGSSNGPPPSRPTSQQNASSPHKRSGKNDDVGRGQTNEGFDNHPPSLHCSHSPAKHSQAKSPSDGGSATHRSQKGYAVPPASPPKKRMFGSSGPGAEVLVAMERSYRQNLAEERRRKEELRAQARKTSAEELAEQDLSEIIEDDLFDEIDSGAIPAGSPHEPPDDLAGGDMSPGTSRRRSPIGKGTNAGPNAAGRTSDTQAEPVASQETDYGDFDFDAGEELDLLADITWADDDLSDI